MIEAKNKLLRWKKRKSKCMSNMSIKYMHCRGIELGEESTIKVALITKEGGYPKFLSMCSMCGLVVLVLSWGIRV